MKKLINFFLELITPVVKFVGQFHMPFSRKKISGADYYRWRDLIEPGMVILTKTEGELSNLLNPTKIKHAGIYIGPIDSSGICYVAEAVGKGVVLTDLVTFLTTKDVAVGCFPKGFKTEMADALCEEALGFLHVPYDFIFKLGKEAFYCFELAGTCLETVIPSLQLKLNEIVKSKVIYDENTFLDTNNFNILFDSRTRQK